MGYNIEYREVGAGGDWRAESLFNPSIDSLTLYNLVLFKTYEFKIRAFNGIGQSDWSVVIELYMEIGTTIYYFITGCWHLAGLWSLTGMTNYQLISSYGTLCKLSWALLL